MLHLEQVTAFLAIALIITFAPGPDNLMVLGQSLSRGRMAGFGIALGCAAGCLTHVLLAVFGISAVIASSPALFLALKLAGAAYLAWLGYKAIRYAAPPTIAAAPSAQEPWWVYLRRGFIAAAVNPKLALFFLAFLPQFTRPAQGHVSLQMLQLGLLFAAQAALVFCLIAVAAGTIGRLLSRHPRSGAWLDRLTGLIFIALAIRLVLTGHKG